MSNNFNWGPAADHGAVPELPASLNVMASPEASLPAIATSSFAGSIATHESVCVIGLIPSAEWPEKP